MCLPITASADGRESGNKAGIYRGRARECAERKMSWGRM